MKFSATLIAIVSADDKKVPPGHPLDRLNRLTGLSTDILVVFLGAIEECMDTKVYQQCQAYVAQLQTMQIQLWEQSFPWWSVYQSWNKFLRRVWTVQSRRSSSGYKSRLISVSGLSCTWLLVLAKRSLSIKKPYEPDVKAKQPRQVAIQGMSLTLCWSL